MCSAVCKESVHVKTQWRTMMQKLTASLDERFLFNLLMVLGELPIKMFKKSFLKADLRLDYKKVLQLYRTYPGNLCKAFPFERVFTIIGAD